MANSAVAESIMFIGAVIVATAFVGVFAAVVQEFSNSLRQRGDVAAEELGTDITIINDPDAMLVSPFTLYVKNTGAVVLDATLTDVLVDGQPSGNLTYDVLGSVDDVAWPPGAVLEIQVNDLNPGSGDHRVRVVSSTGVEDRLRFRLP